ncbi:MAG: protoporphyrinogen oxidase [Deltaproteobacteria bacterium]|nr:MAG: protoporphyrinogen oxidase [Deltaproteobacteria bacterium]
MKVAVVGAGVVGMTVAWHLRRAGVDVVVLEASGRVGGVVKTLQHEGALVEQGPQSLRSAGSATAELVSALGLIAQVAGPSRAARRRYLLMGGRLRPVPSGPGDLLRPSAFRARDLVRAALEPLIPASEAQAGQSGLGAAPESVAEFVARRLGPGAAYPMIDAFVAGIYAGDAHRMEAEAAFPGMVAAEREHGSVVIGMMRTPRSPRPDWLPRTTFTFERGVQTLTRALHESLGGVVRLNAEVTGIERLDGGLRVVGPFGMARADQVILAVPSWVAARIHPVWAPSLATIGAAPVAAVHLAWPRGEGPSQQGFGFLIPSRERFDALGAIWVSSTFPHLAPGWDLIRVLVGGARAPDLPRLSDRALRSHALRVVRQVQGPTPDPSWVQVARHLPGIPQYGLGHSRIMRQLDRAATDIHLLGWGYRGIGLSQGLDAARALAAKISAP